MHRIRDWLRNRYLPTWAAESLKEENDALRRRNKELLDKLGEQQMYISGMKDVIQALCPNFYAEWGDRNGRT